MENLIEKNYNAVIRLRKDTKENYEKVKSTLVPLSGEVCLVEEDNHVRAKVGDGSTSFGELEYSDKYIIDEINSVVVNGYLLNGKFYTDSTYTVELPVSINRVYINRNQDFCAYAWDAENERYEKIRGNLPNATADVAGIAKLYGYHGDAEDGSMTQKAITNGVKAIHFNVDTKDDECLVLDLSAWD